MEDSIIQSIAHQRSRQIEPSVLRSITHLHESLPPDAARLSNLELLGRGNAVVITTGQQLGLFLGPMYTLYKALSVVRLSRQLSAATGVPVIPLFWLQTEDHDYQEIRSTQLLSDTGVLSSISLPPDPAPRLSIHERVLPAEVTDCLSEFEQILGVTGNQALLEVLRTSYLPGRQFHLAFATALSQLLPGSGLVFFNPRCPNVSSASSRIWRTAYQEYNQISQLLQHSDADIQVHIREDSPLFFYHPQPDGPRYRLRKANDSWQLVGGDSFVANQIIVDQLQHHPEHFSSSALLRPILQDHLLPSIAYVGGPAEEKYFKQIEQLFPLFSLPKPNFLNRLSCTLEDEKAHSLRAKLGLEISDLTKDTTELLQGLPGQDLRILPDSFIRNTEGLLASVITALEPAVAIDQTLHTPLQRTQKKIEDAVDLFISKYERAYSLRMGIQRARIDRLKNFYFPDGVAQERVLNTAYLVNRFGVELPSRILTEESELQNTLLSL